MIGEKRIHFNLFHRLLTMSCTDRKINVVNDANQVSIHRNIDVDAILFDEDGLSIHEHKYPLKGFRWTKI